jgi:hypothetical protein
MKMPGFVSDDACGRAVADAAIRIILMICMLAGEGERGRKQCTTTRTMAYCEAGGCAWYEW